MKEQEYLGKLSLKDKIIDTFLRLFVNKDLIRLNRNLIIDGKKKTTINTAFLVIQRTETKYQIMGFNTNSKFECVRKDTLKYAEKIIDWHESQEKKIKDFLKECEQ